jgi:hypothetical protein
MKTYKTWSRVLAAVALLFASSCKDILDLEPQTALSPQAAYTVDRIELVIAGMYDAAQSGIYAGGAVRGYPFGAAHIEQGDNRGEDVVNTQAFFAITYDNTYDPTTANNDWHFQSLFRLINRTNVVLDELNKFAPTETLTQASIDAYKGEATFLRALAYHELAKHFCRPYSDNPTAPNGGMPYRKTGITDATAADAAAPEPRGTVQSLYSNIIADLDYAESVLPATRTGANLKITRATKGAAIAMKTRVYLGMGNWDKVIEEGNKLVPAATATPSILGAYALAANPYAPFTAPNSKSSTELIFSIDNSAEDNPSVNGALASMYSTSTAPTSGRALVAISPIIWNKPWFNATDVRKTSVFVDINVEGTTAGGKGGYFSKKYTDVTARSDNAPVIRYPEVLLSLAEAIQRKVGTPDARAFQLYNAVRARANAAGTDANYDQISDFATGNALIQAIHNERRIEFLCEGLRWFDIHRLAQDATFNTWGGGIPVKVSRNLTNYRPYYTGLESTTTTLLATAGNRHDAIPYSNYRFIWPIPNSEIILNPVLAQQQNPGY